MLENDYAHHKPLNATDVEQGTPGDDKAVDVADEICSEDDGAATDKREDRDDGLYGSLVV